MPTKHHYGYWITADGETGYGDLLFIDPFDLTEQKKQQLEKKLESKDFGKVFQFVRSLLRRY